MSITSPDMLVEIGFDLSDVGGPFFTFGSSTVAADNPQSIFDNTTYRFGGTLFYDVTDRVTSVSINRGLSRDDVFVLNGRQKPLTTKKLDLWLTLEPSAFCDENMLRGWKRNQQLVDLNFIPDAVRKAIMESYSSQAGKSRDKLFTYFVEHRLKNLMSDIDQF